MKHFRIFITIIFLPCFIGVLCPTVFSAEPSKIEEQKPIKIEQKPLSGKLLQCTYRTLILEKCQQGMVTSPPGPSIPGKPGQVILPNLVPGIKFKTDVKVINLSNVTLSYSVHGTMIITSPIENPIGDDITVTSEKPCSYRTTPLTIQPGKTVVHRMSCGQWDCVGEPSPLTKGGKFYVQTSDGTTYNCFGY